MRSRTWASLSLRGPLCLPFVCARRLLAVCVPPCQWVFEGSGWVGWGGGRDRVTESERVRGRVILIRMEAGRGRSFSCFFSGLSPISPFYLLGECSSFFLCHFCLPHPRVQPILPSHFSVFCFALFRLSILKYHPFSSMSCILHSFFRIFVSLSRSPILRFKLLTNVLVLS